MSSFYQWSNEDNADGQHMANFPLSIFLFCYLRRKYKIGLFLSYVDNNVHSLLMMQIQIIIIKVILSNSA